ncbi:NAD(P)-binding protein [Lophiostoma macrostomum CBS 122681]|uniref:NAD(P)-binding protein n=1 Tax=Lophiostoma macrostomum CBS 122681 TaxID=1314788 RepID=A0A6A6SSY2_9PLEO|nr:NAD(P)-binding protein [Lophiostoma macrostomum CBS 122681]
MASTSDFDAKSASPKIILVTGANRGLGNAITHALASAYPQHTYILGIRTLSSSTTALTDLRAAFPDTTFSAIELDVSSDASIAAAAAHLTATYPHLDVLVNNAGIATRAQPGQDAWREQCNRVLDVNCTAVGAVTWAFMPLLKAGGEPQVINLSSARASMHLQTTAQLPPTASIPYSVSKTALNVLMLELAKLEPGVLFQAVLTVLWRQSPGHCRTALNGFTGKKEPLDGAEVVVRLVGDEGERWGQGFWEFEDGEVRRVAW